VCVCATAAVSFFGKRPSVELTSAGSILRKTQTRDNRPLFSLFLLRSFILLAAAELRLAALNLSLHFSGFII